MWKFFSFITNIFRWPRSANDNTDQPPADAELSEYASGDHSKSDSAYKDAETEMRDLNRARAEVLASINELYRKRCWAERNLSGLLRSDGVNLQVFFENEIEMLFDQISRLLLLTDVTQGMYGGSAITNCRTLYLTYKDFLSTHVRCMKIHLEFTDLNHSSTDSISDQYKQIQNLKMKLAAYRKGLKQFVELFGHMY